jgi:hypothetical protein
LARVWVWVPGLSERFNNRKPGIRFGRIAERRSCDRDERPQSSPRRPARFATAFANSPGSTGFGTCAW